MYHLALLLYNLLFPALFLLYLPFYLRKLRRRGNYRRGFWERFGIYGRRRQELQAYVGCTWVHAVSVGEAVAALGLIRRWQEAQPGRRFVLSTTTSTGQQLARDKAPDGVAVIYFPIDVWPCVRSALRLLQPAQLVLFEVEVWPNIIRLAGRRGIPVSLVNCRMSDRSAAGYRRHRWFFRHVFDSFAAILVQTQEDARRVAAIVDRADAAEVCGTMKFDQTPDREGGDIGPLLDRVFPADRLCFCAASTHAPEEEVIARLTAEVRAEVPQLRLILVPRHQERQAEAEAALTAAGLDYCLLTDLRASAEGYERAALIVNTTGELMDFLAASDLVFVGKSLGDFGGDGGHNIIEPAIFGKPILHGPAMENFRDVAAVFQAAEAAIQVADEADLRARLLALATQPDLRARYARASRETVERHRGAIARTIDRLEDLPAAARG